MLGHRLVNSAIGHSCARRTAQPCSYFFSSSATCQHPKKCVARRGTYYTDKKEEQPRITRMTPMKEENQAEGVESDFTAASLLIGVICVIRGSLSCRGNMC